MEISAEENVDRKIIARNLSYEKALAFEHAKNFSKALEFYRMSLKIDNQFFDSWLNAGAIYSKIGKAKKAIICFQRAIVSNPDKRAYYNLGSEYFKAERFDEAKKMFFKAIKLDHHFLQAHLLLGYTFGKLGSDEKAKVSIKNALKIDPENQPAMTALALLYFHMKKFKQSAYYVGKLLKSNPENLTAQRLKANIMLESGNIKGSIETFKDLADEDPKLKAFHYSLSENQTKEGRAKISEKKKHIVKKSHKNANDWLDLSLLTLFEGDAKTALDYLQEASGIENATSM